MVLEWKDPPTPQPSKADVAAAELRERPGEWALIARETGLIIAPWWMPICRSPFYETKLVHRDRLMFGDRDVYARYTGQSGDSIA